MNTIELTASRYWTASFTKTIFPDRLQFRDNRLELVKKTWLGLRDNTEVINLKQIASIRLKNGFFYSTVIVETTGGAKKDLYIKWVGKKNAKNFVEEVNGMLG